MKRWLCSALVAAFLAPALARAQDEEDDAPLAEASVDARFPPHRYAYAGAGLFLAGGLGFSYWAQGEARRAEKLANARDAERNLQTARQSAATANMLYALAGLTLAYGLVLEFLPEQAAAKADLTFHF